MPDNEIDLKEIRKRVEKQMNKRVELATHFAAYAFCMAILAIVIQPEFNFPILAIIGLPWSLGMVIHATQTYMETVVVPNAQEKAIQREIEIELWHREGRVPGFYKEKRKGIPQRLVMGSDGEIGLSDDEQAQSLEYGR